MIKTLVFYSIVIAAAIVWLILNDSELIIENYQYFYFTFAVILWFLSYHFFGGRFIRPKWKKAGKLIAYLIISGVMLVVIGHYALIFIVGHQMLGGVGHFIICKKNGIDWRTCQPEERYIALTEKWAKGNFS